MTLTTIIAYHPSQDDNSIEQSAGTLLGQIRMFATNLSSHAFWDEATAHAKNCIVVWGNGVELEEASQVKCHDIDKVVAQWCKDVAEYLRDLSREDEQAEGLDVEIKDVEWSGGLRITCTDRDGNQPFVLWILPVKGGGQ